MIKCYIDHMKRAESIELVASEWLKKAIIELEDRDIVDVLNELEYLTYHFNQKLKVFTEAEKI